MKKFLLTAATVLLILSMLGGCNKLQIEISIVTEPSASVTEPSVSVTEPVTTSPIDTTPAEPEANTQPSSIPVDTQTQSNTSTITIDTPYSQQIARYYTAISNQWDENAYFEHEMSPLAANYYEGNPLNNVGFALLDLDGDGTEELVIGAIMNAQKDPLVFEIWTLKNGEPVILAQSGSRNRYYLQYSAEDNLWSIAYEAENGAANRAVYYLFLSDGKFEVMQGILFDAFASENAPWFMTYDLDWDISNDMSIDEDTANAVMDAARNIYACTEYFPYTLFK